MGAGSLTTQLMHADSICRTADVECRLRLGFIGYDNTHRLARSTIKLGRPRIFRHVEQSAASVLIALDHSRCMHCSVTDRLPTTAEHIDRIQVEHRRPPSPVLCRS